MMIDFDLRRNLIESNINLLSPKNTDIGRSTIRCNKRNDHLLSKPTLIVLAGKIKGE